ncbi:hypothetical protein AVEN_106080-1 [Araneus ventricosus]|uniref:Uncharacterized protein n=1 Tax=Araneus ventricosus TaxID=182803 RepID=A0A4Y2NW73_ARAVE|nr:hypothetical protein AVEN_106080-1 [Araneus ventricosus]
MIPSHFFSRQQRSLPDLWRKRVLPPLFKKTSLLFSLPSRKRKWRPRRRMKKDGSARLISCECMLMIPEGQQSYFRSMSLYTLKKSKINEDPL